MSILNSTWMKYTIISLVWLELEHYVYIWKSWRIFFQFMPVRSIYNFFNLIHSSTAVIYSIYHTWNLVHRNFDMHLRSFSKECSHSLMTVFVEFYNSWRNPNNSYLALKMELELFRGQYYSFLVYIQVTWKIRRHVDIVTCIKTCSDDSL